MSTRKEVFSPATIPSTLSSEPVSRTWARGLEPGSRHWNNSCRVGLGFGREVGTSAGAPECPCGHSILQVWGGRDLPRGTSASLGTIHLPSLGDRDLAPGHPCGHSILQVWGGVGTSPGAPGPPWGQSIFQCPHFPQVGHTFAGGLWVWAYLCPVS